MKNIGVVGLGKLGLCLALNLERNGYRVIGVDVNEEHIEKINRKTLKSNEPQVEELLTKSKKLIATTNYNDLINENCDLIFIVVATPSLDNGGYDHTQVQAVIDNLLKLGERFKKTHLVVNCTTMPGYCDTLAECLNDSNYTLSYNPEFIAQGSIINDQIFPDQVLIGSNDEEAVEAIQSIYQSICKSSPEYCKMNLVSAELTKLATNCFLTTKISFANSIGDLATKVGAEPEKVLHAIGSDKRIGNKYLKYGFGYGGPCFPRDNRALAKFGIDNNMNLLLCEATDLSNQKHLDFQFNQLMKIPNSEIIEFNHVTYKKGTKILEESQQLALALKLSKAGKKVKIYESEEVIALLKINFGELFIYERSK